MTGFLLKTPTGETIRFRYYTEAAPATVAAFEQQLPFTRTFMHARVSGQEIWIDDAPPVDVIQENASVFTEPGEIVLGPINSTRARTAGCLGIYYGEGKGLDACNIFGKVFEEDLEKLKELGNNIWRNGVQELRFERME
jgi:hypothetical protein